MVRKRAAKKKSSAKRKQGRRSNEGPDEVNNNNSHDDLRSNATTASMTTTTNPASVFTSPSAGGMPFFSPPAADLNSLMGPVARPIHTPYSTRGRRLNSQLSDVPSSGGSLDSNGACLGPSPASSSISPQRSGELAEQVRDLNHLLTSPLVEHLGALAETQGQPTLGAMESDEDDMSEEWGHLAQSESLLREELENLYSPPQSEDSSLPPAIARQRLDPVASPLHPFNLFASSCTEEKKETSSPREEKKVGSPRRKRTASAGANSSSVMSPRSYINNYEEAEHIAEAIEDQLAHEDSFEESILSAEFNSPRRKAMSSPRQHATPNDVVVKVKSMAKLCTDMTKKGSNSPSLSQILNCTGSSSTSCGPQPQSSSSSGPQPQSSSSNSMVAEAESILTDERPPVAEPPAKTRSSPARRQQQQTPTRRIRTFITSDSRIRNVISSGNEPHKGSVYPSLADSSSGETDDSANNSSALALHGSVASSEHLGERYLPLPDAVSEDRVAELAQANARFYANVLMNVSGSSSERNTNKSSSSDEFGPRLDTESDDFEDCEPMYSPLAPLEQKPAAIREQEMESPRLYQQRSPPRLASLKGNDGELPPTINAALEIAAAYDSSVGTNVMGVEDSNPRKISTPIHHVIQDSKWKEEQRAALSPRRKHTSQTSGTDGSKATNNHPTQGFLEGQAKVASIDAALQRAVDLNGSTDSEDEDNNIVKDQPGRDSNNGRQSTKYRTPQVPNARTKSQKSTVKFQTPLESTLRFQTPMVASSRIQHPPTTGGLAKYHTPMVGTDATDYENPAYYTAIQSSRFDDNEDIEERMERTDLGKELDQLVHSLPGFSPAAILDDLEFTSAAARMAGNRHVSADRGSTTNTAVDFVDPEISRLVHAVQEQLDQSSTLTPDTPITFEQIERQMSNLSSVNNSIKRSQSPALSEGIMQVITGEEESQEEQAMTHLGRLQERFQIDTIQSMEFENETDEDDNMGYELDHLESSQNALREALELSVDKYSLPPTPIPKAAPQITGNLLNEGNGQEQSLSQPVPQEHPATDSAVASPRAQLPPLNQQQSTAPSTNTVATTTMTGTITTEEETDQFDQNNLDLGYYHERDPEPVMSASSAALDGVGLSCSSSDINISHVALGSMSDGSISTIANNSLTVASSSPVSFLDEKLKHLSPVSQASSTRSPLTSHISPDPVRPGEDASIGTSTSTPVRRGGGVATPVNQSPSCKALNQLVRSPSDNSTEGGQSASLPPFQFLEEGDTPSPTAVPFAPDEWAFRQNRSKLVSCENHLDADVGKNTITDLEQGGTPRPVKMNIDRTEVWAGDMQQKLDSFYLTEELDDQSEKTDLFSKSKSRMKDLNHKSLDDHPQKPPQCRPSRTPRRGPQKDASSTRSNPERIDAPAPWFRQPNRLIQSMQSMSTCLQDHGVAPHSPIRKEATVELLAPEQDSPLSAKSADYAWAIKSRADGRNAAVALNAALLDLGNFRPSKSLRSPLSLTPTKGTPDSPGRRSRKKSLGATTPPKAYVDSMAKSPDSEEQKAAANVDVEDPSSTILLDSAKDPDDHEELGAKFWACTRNYTLCAAIACVWFLFLGLVVLLGVLVLRSPDDPSDRTGASGTSMVDVMTEHPAAAQTTPTMAPVPVSPTLPPIVGTIITHIPPTDPPQPALSPTEHPAAAADTFVTALTPSPTTGAPLVPGQLLAGNPTSSPPTLSPNKRPTIAPVSNSTLNLVSLIVSNSVDQGAALLDRTSPEYASLTWLTTNVLLDSYSDQQKIQRYVLGTVYFAMNGAGWTENARWLTEWDECRWFSRSRRNPVCNRDGEFVNLDLGYLDVSGTLPKALGMLSNSLERINLEGGPIAFITGTIPSELGLLTLMRELNLAENEITGTVPGELRRWTFLEDLDLHANNFRGSLPFRYPFWTSLTTVNVGENSFVGSISTSIGRQERLSKLILRDNLLHGAIPSEIGLLTNLRDIYLDQNNLHSFPTEIGHLGRLENLMIAANSLSNEIPSEIGLLSMLRTLSLTFNNLQGKIPTEIGHLVQLRDRVDLSFNDLTGKIPSEIGKLTRMKHLLLQSNYLSGSLPDEVAALHRLNTLRIDDNDMSGRVSEEVCGVFNQTLPYFYADCSEIDCPCCIFCCEEENGCACRHENTFDQYLCY